MKGATTTTEIDLGVDPLLRAAPTLIEFRISKTEGEKENELL